MLAEIPKVKQIPGEPQRRWFMDNFFDLIVWLDEQSQIIGFQLCYDVSGNERALTWRRKVGFQHQRVDDGERHGMRFKGTPILVADGAFEGAHIAEVFRVQSLNIDSKIAEFMIEKLQQFVFRERTVRG